MEAQAAKADSDARDEEHRVYQFRGTVDRDSVSRCITALSRWHRIDPECAIEIVFNSPGGSVIDGMALFDYLIQLGKTHTVTTVCRGMAASMAGILLQAGTHRVIGAESYLMIHELSAITGGKVGEIEDSVKFYKTICDRVVDIFVKRSGGKCSKALFVKSWSRQDWWLTSAEALRLGFVDEIR
jgi:ATP-dependent Clp endopeptidase proteolytic subunit ClpP